MSKSEEPIRSLTNDLIFINDNRLALLEHLIGERLGVKRKSEDTTKLKECLKTLRGTFKSANFASMLLAEGNVHEFKVKLGNEHIVKSAYSGHENGMVNHICKSDNHLKDSLDNYLNFSKCFQLSKDIVINVDSVPNHAELSIKVENVGGVVKLSAKYDGASPTCSYCGDKYELHEHNEVYHCVNNECIGNVIGIINTYNDSPNINYWSRIDYIFHDGKVIVTDKEIGPLELVNVEQAYRYIYNLDTSGSEWALVELPAHPPRYRAKMIHGDLRGKYLSYTYEIIGNDCEDSSETNLYLFADKLYSLSGNEVSVVTDDSKWQQNTLLKQKIIQKTIHVDLNEFMLNHVGKVRLPYNIDYFTKGQNQGSHYKDSSKYPYCQVYITMNEQNAKQVLSYLKDQKLKVIYCVTDIDPFNYEN
tara:strand:- start:8862 stop:10115 length:1254 start_codon:yes stop_codon:yes gene_type:complete